MVSWILLAILAFVLADAFEGMYWRTTFWAADRSVRVPQVGWALFATGVLFSGLGRLTEVVGSIKKSTLLTTIGGSIWIFGFLFILIGEARLYQHKNTKKVTDWRNEI